MKSAVESLEPTRVKLTIEVPHEELKPSIDAALKAIAGQVAIPGFRPGKVPLRLVEQRVGRSAVLQEAINEAMPEFYGQALAEHELRPLGQPEIEVTEIPVEDGQPLAFSAEVDIRPEIDLPEWSTIEVEVDALDDASVAEAAEERMTALRQRFGTLVGVERPAAQGDFVSVDLTASIAGEEIDSAKGISYEIGSGNMLQGMDEALVGLSAGASTTFTAPLAGGDHAGEDADITLTLGSVKERELPELDDEFAQLASEFDTLDELREDLSTQARRAKAFEQGIQARDKVLETLLAKVDLPVPSRIVEAEVHNHLEGESRLDDDEHRAEVTESTTAALRTQLLLDAIAEKEEVEVGQPELVEYLIMTAQQYGMDPGQLAKSLEEQDQIAAMVGEVARRKALATVLEQAKVVDTSGAVVDLNALTEGEEEGEDVSSSAPAEEEPAASSEAAPAKKTAKKTAKKAAKKAAAAPADAESDEPAGDAAEAEAEAKPAKKTAKKAAKKAAETE